MRSAILLLSGGLDSTVLLADLIDRGWLVHGLLVDYGQPHVKEVERAEAHAKRFGILHTRLKIPALGGMTGGDWIVPNRNMILISLAVNLAIRSESDTVAIGCNGSDADNFPDCTSYFIANMKVATRASGTSVEVVAPYLDLEKKQIVQKAKTFGISLESIWTCYRGGDQPCGTCGACTKLKEACC